MFKWYQVFNLDSFLEAGLVSREYKIAIAGVGEKTIVAFSAVGVSILVDDIFLTIGLNEKNPMRFDTYAVFLDENDDVWLGIYEETDEN